MLIYKEKTPKCFPRVDFLTWILLSANEKHFSNTQESLKLLDEIIVPYMKKKTWFASSAPWLFSSFYNRYFSGQIAMAVINSMHDIYVKLVKIPLIYLFPSFISDASFSWKLIICQTIQLKKILFDNRLAKINLANLLFLSSMVKLWQLSRIFSDHTISERMIK